MVQTATQEREDTSPAEGKARRDSKSSPLKGKLYTDEAIEAIRAAAGVAAGRKWKGVETERDTLTVRNKALTTENERLHDAISQGRIEELKDEPDKAKLYATAAEQRRRETELADREDTLKRDRVQLDSDMEDSRAKETESMIPRLVAKYSLAADHGLGDLGITDEVTLDKVASRMPKAKKTKTGDGDSETETTSETEEKTSEDDDYNPDAGQPSGQRTSSELTGEKADKMSLDELSEELEPKPKK